MFNDKVPLFSSRESKLYKNLGVCFDAKLTWQEYCSYLDDGIIYTQNFFPEFIQNDFIFRFIRLTSHMLFLPRTVRQRFIKISCDNELLANFARTTKCDELTEQN